MLYKGIKIVKGIMSNINYLITCFIKAIFSSRNTYHSKYLSTLIKKKSHNFIETYNKSLTTLSVRKFSFEKWLPPCYI